ncbi:hypothetical protein FRB94_007436 [Tulasnella sp. JGI-2019a]|nr:hypothetical protein FRB93_002941 [Tulasnella sp. JGI-2019a]KAG8997828.1 hypothetical protein FRB94_007436 [Tulasnella sp. JGI-2019a]KAG9026439.1 hypothetical protein FRB95_008846 [Tulasnella sp. JGI-2019a]
MTTKSSPPPPSKATKIPATEINNSPTVKFFIADSSQVPSCASEVERTEAYLFMMRTMGIVFDANKLCSRTVLRRHGPKKISETKLSPQSSGMRSYPLRTLRPTSWSLGAMSISSSRRSTLRYSIVMPSDW